jgi:hypothetical protein
VNGGTGAAISFGANSIGTVNGTGVNLYLATRVVAEGCLVTLKSKLPKPCPDIAHHSCSRSAFASLRSSVSKPSVNQP